MAPGDQRPDDLDRLTDRVGRLLGRLDEQVERLADGTADVDAFDAAAQIEDDTTELHGLLDALVRAARSAERGTGADLDATVASAISRELHRIEHPLVIRQKLAGRLPEIACSPRHCAHLVDRALALATAHAGHGGEILVATRQDDATVELQMTSVGHGEPGARDRSATLREFVEELGGQCDAEVDQAGCLRLAVQLPAAVELGER